MSVFKKINILFDLQWVVSDVFSSIASLVNAFRGSFLRVKLGALLFLNIQENVFCVEQLEKFLSLFSTFLRTTFKKSQFQMKNYQFCPLVQEFSFLLVLIGCRLSSSQGLL